MPKRVVITGATGLIGSNVCLALRNRGDAFVALSRHPARAKAALPDAERCVLWSPGLRGEWENAIDGADAVIHLAAESIGARRWSPAVKRDLIESRVRGTRGLVEAIARAEQRPALLLSASGIGYYGDAGDELLFEDAPPGSDFLAQICVAWEAEAHRAAPLGVRVVMPRIGLVLASAGGALPRLRRSFSFFAGGPLGSGAQWFPWIHLDDLVAALLHCIDHGDVQGPVNVLSPERARNRDFSAALGAAMDRPSWLPVPALLLRLALGEFAGTLLGGQRASADALLASGFVFRHPSLAEALASLAR